MMYVRKVRRRCGVRNCKTLDSYAISRTREAGQSVIICEDCLREALKAIEDGNVGLPKQPKELREAPPLFFNAAIAESRKAAAEARRAAGNDKIAAQTADEVPKTAEKSDKMTAENGAFVCTQCGRAFTTETGFKRHRCKELRVRDD